MNIKRLTVWSLPVVVALMLVFFWFPKNKPAETLTAQQKCVANAYYLYNRADLSLDGKEMELEAAGSPTIEVSIRRRRLQEMYCIQELDCSSERNALIDSTNFDDCLKSENEENKSNP